MAVRLLLATDFDGTIAGIRESPEEVHVDPSVHEFFSSLNDRDDVAVAILSGRDLDDLEPRTAGIVAYRSGSHGHELSLPAGERIRSGEPWKGTPDRDWIRRASNIGLRIEPKKFGIAVHWRGVEGISSDHPLLVEFAQWARGASLDVTPGRFVIEAAVAGARKEIVLEEIAKRVGEPRVLYAGDDFTDFGALTWAAARGRGFFLQSAERPEKPVGAIEVLGSLSELLARWREEVARL